VKGSFPETFLRYTKGSVNHHVIKIVHLHEDRLGALFERKQKREEGAGTVRQRRLGESAKHDRPEEASKRCGKNKKLVVQNGDSARKHKTKEESHYIKRG